jgi:molybdopterin-containing oxidoreductase family membrane subunit
MKLDPQVIGLFKDERLAAAAVEEVAGTPWRIKDVHTPVRSERILKALGVKKSRVGYFTLAGGIIGFMLGLSLSLYTSLEWSLIVGGKHPVSLIPYFIVGFEFTVLFAVLGNILGFVMQTQLPEFQSIRTYDPGCSGEYFGILVSCPAGQEEALKAFFKNKGGEARVV